MRADRFLPSEADEQVLLVRWLQVVALAHDRSSNETASSPEAQRRTGRMKAADTSAGFPDLVGSTVTWSP